VSIGGRKLLFLAAATVVSESVRERCLIGVARRRGALGDCLAGLSCLLTLSVLIGAGDTFGLAVSVFLVGDFLMSTLTSALLLPSSACCKLMLDGDGIHLFVLSGKSSKLLR